jgi:hypothetical protein
LLFFLIYSFFTLVPILANEEFNIKHHLKVTGMEQAEAPHVFERQLILSYEADHPVRYVAAAFGHENYNTLHTFTRNKHDVYVLTYPIPEDKHKLVYRIVVDGLWRTDPRNPHTTVDEHSIRVSVFDIPELPQAPITGPERVDGKLVRFYYKGEAHNRVYLTGSFNNWDPFLHLMQEQKPGFYTITIQLPPGEHFYYFISNGKKQLDPYNSSLGSDVDGMVVSYLDLR